MRVPRGEGRRQQVIPKRQHEERRIQNAEQQQADPSQREKEVGQTVKNCMHRRRARDVKHDCGQFSAGSILENTPGFQRMR
jgi:hypothetical protein